MKVKDVSRVSAKWADRAGSATGQYAEGVQNPSADWETATIAAQENYKQAVTKAANEGRFGKGVRQAGTAKQQNAALSKGVGRYSQGVAVAQPEYAAAIEPYLTVIANTNLPPRKPKGDPSNIARVAAIATALHAAKMGKR